MLENRDLFTVYYIPEVNEIYKVTGDKTVRIRLDKVLPNFQSKKVAAIPELWAYHVANEMFIECFNRPRFKAKVVRHEDNTFQLTDVRWIDAPGNPDIADTMLKKASDYLKLPPPKDVQIESDLKRFAPKKTIRKKTKPKKLIPKEDQPPKPEFCIYNVYGESFIEHQFQPRFKALITQGNEMVKLQVVLWIDQEPEDATDIDTLFNRTLTFLKENLHP